MMNWKGTPPSDCKVQCIVSFLTTENDFRAKIHCCSCTVSGEENVMNLRNIQ